MPVFENTLTRSLSISKTLEGTSENTAFRFIVNVDGVGTEPYKAVRISSSETTEEEVAFAEDGTAEITVNAGERLTIYGLPANARWSVEEITEGYTVRYSVNGGSEQNGSIAVGSLDSLQTEVSFINREGYTLPITGGHGTMIYYATGSLLLLLGAMLLIHKSCLYKRR